MPNYVVCIQDDCSSGKPHTCVYHCQTCRAKGHAFKTKMVWTSYYWTWTQGKQQNQMVYPVASSKRSPKDLHQPWPYCSTASLQKAIFPSNGNMGWSNPSSRRETGDMQLTSDTFPRHAHGANCCSTSWDWSLQINFTAITSSLMRSTISARGVLEAQLIFTVELEDLADEMARVI